MNEIRIDRLTGKQVIIAVNRKNRPIDKKEEALEQITSDSKSFNDKCPFCKGNEEETPREIFREGKENWRVRVIKNKYPAVTEEGQALKGYHYVVVESPEHNIRLYQYSKDNWKDIFNAYKFAVSKCFKDTDIQYVQIFKNYKKEGGASLEHPHSQIVALNFTPQNKLIERKICLVCEECDEEQSFKERIILENDEFIAYTPYGSIFQNQVRIASKHHICTVEEVFEDRIDKLALTLEELFKIVYKALGDVPLNICYYIHKESDEGHHFYIDILPRGTFFAGLEMSTDIYINVVSPEEAAEKFREAADCIQQNKVEL